MKPSVIILMAVAIGRVSSSWLPFELPNFKQLPVNDSLPHPEPKAFAAPASLSKPDHLDPESQSLTLVPASQTPFGRQSTNCQSNHNFNSPGESLTFQSLNYPEEYPNDQDTSMCFSSPSGTTMQVSCKDFHVEWERYCRFDYLGLSMTGSASNIQKYCGRGVLESPQTSGNSLRVVFHSDYSNPDYAQDRKPYRYKCTVQVSGGSSTTTKPPQNCNCGQRNNKIVGGQEAKPNELPWRCFLRTNRYSFFCGCSILSNRFILTAAHCTRAVYPLQQGDAMYVVVGAHDRRTGDTPGIKGQQIQVADVFDHPGYDRRTMDNDISILELNETMTFSNAISPLCLPYDYVEDEFQGTKVTASGWGTKNEGGSTSNVLMEVELPVLTTQECSRYLPREITPNMICTYEPGKDTCQGDSGGSIDLLRNGRYYGIGIVSWGYGCAQEDKPGVYTKVTRYLDWIEFTTGQKFCRPS